LSGREFTSFASQFGNIGRCDTVRFRELHPSARGKPRRLNCAESNRCACRNGSRLCPGCRILRSVHQLC
jgi:hypothetical protein